jgi:hypothetical protein
MKIGRVISSSVGTNRDGETPVRLLRVEISDPDDVQTVEYAQAAGEDFNPPPNTTVYILEAGEAWKLAIAADDGIAPTALSGDRHIYAVDPITGLAAAIIKLLTTGIIEAGATGLDFVAQAGKVLTELQGLKTHLDALKTAIDTHTHTVAITGPAGTTPTTPPLAPGPTPPTPGSVASANLKSED